MGFIRDIVNAADNSKQVTDDIKENLGILMQLADNKAKLFAGEIEQDLLTGKTIDNLTIPITKVVAKETQTRGITVDTTSDIIEEISRRSTG